MRHGSNKFLIIMIVTSFIAGMIVLTLKKDYTTEKNIKSNERYYPNIVVQE